MYDLSLADIEVEVNMILMNKNIHLTTLKIYIETRIRESMNRRKSVL